VIRVQVSDGTRDIKIAIDLADQRDLFHMPELDPVDLYFKRSFHAPAVQRLAPELAHKVRPFGLNTPGADMRTSARILAARLRTGRSSGELATDARHLLALPPPSAFECPPERPARLQVLVQTRLWPGQDVDVLAVNEERAALIRALRRAFGPRFIGGAIADPFALENFGELVSPVSRSLRGWPKLLKSALVTVYSRGLHNSLAFKMGEYLAASRCIVAQPSDLTLPEPLVAGSHYAPFGDPDECIAGCERLLSNPTEALEMRRQNWAYYWSQVEPAAQLLRMLEESLRPSERTRGSAN
jgi:hypothetical protein